MGPLQSNVRSGGVGFSGLAVVDGQIFASTSFDKAPSALHRLDPATGESLSQVPVTSGGQQISLSDLAARPGGELFGLRSADDGGGRAGRLYRIDVDTGAATLVGDTGVSDGSLAFDSEGNLWLAGLNRDTQLGFLYNVDPATAEVQSSVQLTFFPRPRSPFSGLAVRDDGAIIGVDSDTGRLMRIAPVSGAVSVIETQAPVHGVGGDLAFLPPALGNFQQLFHEDFEQGPGGFDVDNTGGTQLGMWHPSLGRRMDGLLNHSVDRNFYYGKAETAFGGGNYVTGFDHQGVITSPEIQLPACGASLLSFSYLLDTRPQLNRDFVEVQIQVGDNITTILSRADGSLPETGNRWLTATADLSAFAGMNVRVRFSFDTGDPVIIDPEGWYVDDVKVIGTSCTVSGRKFFDANADGSQDGVEAGLGNWEIRAYADDGDGILSPDELAAGYAARAVTEASGDYSMSLAAGDYVLLEVLQPGWSQSQPSTLVNSIEPTLSANGFAITIPSTAPLSGLDFGNRAPTGVKYYDNNGNGVRDAGERGLADWEIRAYRDTNGNQLLDDGDVLAATATTKSAG